MHVYGFVIRNFRLCNAFDIIIIRLLCEKACQADLAVFLAPDKI